MTAILESFKSMFFGNDVWNDIHSLKHIHRLGLYDGHKNSNSLRLKIFYSCFHGIQSGLVHERNELHPNDNDFGIVGDVVHYFLKTSDRAKKDRSVQTLDIDFVFYFRGKNFFVVPWYLFVKLGYVIGVIAAFHQVAGTFHKEYAGYHHANANGDEQVNEVRREERILPTVQVRGVRRVKRGRVPYLKDGCARRC